MQRAFDRRVVSGLRFVLFQRRHAPVAGHARAPGEHRLEQIALVLEIVVQERRMDADALRHVAQRDAVQAMLGEQVLRGVEDLFQAFGALLGLAAPLALGIFGTY